eukprot:scaffold136523_cov208-Phaeocystis_antarctica.AAC.1
MLVGFAGPPRRSVSLRILSSRTPSTSTPAQEQERHDLPCNLVRPLSLRPPMRAAGCTGQSRPGGDHDHGERGPR